MTDSFNSRTTLQAGGKAYEIHSLDGPRRDYDVDRLPYSLKILLENLLRTEDGVNVTREHIEAVLNWDPKAAPKDQIAFTPARVVLQDFTGVPAVVDLAAMRDAMRDLGGDPGKINPLSPADLVIDHSVMVDHFGNRQALQLNTEIEYQRNRERYEFLRWGQTAFSNFRVVPPGTGIVHQVNLEYLGQVVFRNENGGTPQAYPDTLVGTDSHTTMINGLGILGWGVGGIEAEAAMLGQPISMLVPEVVGFRLEGRLPEGATATDLVLTVTEILRKKGVVGKFVEFFGDGLDHLPLADRATIANMAPEYGATCGIFPVDKETLAYMELSGRDQELIDLTEQYAKAQGMWRETGAREAEYSDTLSLDMGTVVPSLAGPKRPQDRVSLDAAKTSFKQTLQEHLRAHHAVPADEAEEHFEDEGGHSAPGIDDAHERGAVEIEIGGRKELLKHGDVVIAAITSCTNTSNPAVLVAAGLVAKKARERGLLPKPWVKTSLAPGSQVVPAYLKQAGLLDDLEHLGFSVVGFGCTTCIGNSGPLPDAVTEGIREGDLCVTSVLSGNRNFEGRIHQDVRANYLASPPLVVAYALAGTMARDLYNEPLGTDNQGRDVYLKDIWPTQQEVADLVRGNISAGMYREQYANVFDGDDAWQGIDAPQGELYDWRESTYVKNPPYFQGMSKTPEPLQDIRGARCLIYVGDSITTDHISPAGAIHPESPAGQYLQEQGVSPKDFNSYGSRRGNHEVMMRGTFANVRLRNRMAPGTEGGWTTHVPSGEQTSVYDASMRYQQAGTPLVVLAGKEYGTGSSRDWAAKGTKLLGIKAVIAESYERIHRSNLVGFGVLPLQFRDGENAENLGLTGDEAFDIEGITEQPRSVRVVARREDGGETTFEARVRIDTPQEWEYYRHGSILHYVLRGLAGAA
ncbi:MULTISPECIES: aconitate hydratase AcnA [unclassified Halorhodospira]|uniref:aconitate hydratase AcnA n=1 Tax=unclassified Halorhodospira TaxID=2626748 RepID=UPI001EE7917C|nr:MULTISPECIES: aconitate hydratase AcnA [unclassified Halorhodospira]MCG5540527.1 aconitate hydratase AcnA [Halorhodospira sp. M39old]MCG5544977.1 aconitate hydratase AcnA [Halorhodospira sp. M38]